MTKEKEKNGINIVLIILGIIAFGLVIYLIFRLTYSFFTATIKDVGPNRDVVVSSSILEVEYVDGNSNIQFGDLIKPGNKITKEFSVQNTNNATLAGEYAIIIRNIINTFSRTNDVVYKLYKKDSNNQLSLLASGVFPTSSSTATVINDSGNTVTENAASIIYSRDVVQYNTTNNYVLEVEYLNTIDDQSDDMESTLEAKIDIVNVINEQRTQAS